MGSRQEKIDSLRRYTHMIQKQTGRVVRPYRYDGYVNMLNKYGTARDVSERYEFRQEPPIPDETLTMYYEGNGLFARIIDAPAEESIKHGFILEELNDHTIEDFYREALEELDWEETIMTAIKWARLFGGSIAVLMINDGRGIDEPLDWQNIRSIDDIRVYDRSLIQPDLNTMFSYDPDDPFGTRGSRLGMPEYYNVYSRYGNFRVHDSRCLVFQNGILPENTSNSVYQLWGMPEYIRLKRAIRDAEVAHGTAPKLLDRAVQAVYKMKDLSAELATEEGEDRVLRRLQTIDMARGLLNSITIDSEGEEYDFRQFTFTGVSEIIDATCNYLSALTNIPQTILFGRSPAGMNATGMGDMENWYSYCERIQNRMVKKNLRYLLSIVFQAGVYTGEIDEVPSIKVKFNPLWSLSEQEEASLEQMRVSTMKMKADTAGTYVQMQVLDPSEVRKKLAGSDEFDVESILDDYTPEEVEKNDPYKKAQEQQGGGMPGMEGGMPGMGGAPGGMPAGAPGAMPGEGKEGAPGGNGALKGGSTPDTDIGGNAPSVAPAATKIPADMSTREKEKIKQTHPGDPEDTLKNAWEGKKPEGEDIIKKQDDPGDTLKNAWEGVDPKNGQPKAEPDKGGEKKDPEDTLKNAWEGNAPKDARPEKKPDADREKAAPEDTLKNAWEGNTADIIKKPAKAPEKKAGPLPGDTLRNAWEGNIPEEGAREKKAAAVQEKKAVKKAKPLPGDTLRNAWEGNTPAKEGKAQGHPEGEKKEEEPKEGDTLKNAWEGKDPDAPQGQKGMENPAPGEGPEDTLKNAWEGKEPEREWREGKPSAEGDSVSRESFKKTGPGIVRSRRKDIFIRDFRAASREDENRTKGAVGVYVVKDGRILTGVRGPGDGEYLICGPGGHIEDGETPGQAAIRETQEEFGITPMELIPFGRGQKETNGLQPYLFLCLRYEGTPKCDDDEMFHARFTAIEELENSGRLFSPFESGFNELKRKVCGNEYKTEKNIDIHADSGIIRAEAGDPMDAIVQFAEDEEWECTNPAAKRDDTGPLGKAGEPGGAWPEGFPKVCVQTNGQALKESPYYVPAKNGDYASALRLVTGLVKPKRIRQIAESYPGAAAVPIRTVGGGHNQIPIAYADVLNRYGIDKDEKIWVTRKADRTGTGELYRMTSRNVIDGEVEEGRDYIIVDDVVTGGQSINEFRKYIEERGGRVVAATTMCMGQIGSNQIAPKPEALMKAVLKHGADRIRKVCEALGNDGGLRSMTNWQVNYIRECGPDKLDEIIKGVE